MSTVKTISMHIWFTKNKIGHITNTIETKDTFRSFQTTKNLTSHFSKDCIVCII